MFQSAECEAFNEHSINYTIFLPAPLHSITFLIPIISDKWLNIVRLVVYEAGGECSAVYDLTLSDFAHWVFHHEVVRAAVPKSAAAGALGSIFRVIHYYSPQCFDAHPPWCVYVSV